MKQWLFSMMAAGMLLLGGTLAHAQSGPVSLLWPDVAENEGLEDGTYVFSRLQPWAGDFNDVWGFSPGESGGLPYQVELSIFNVQDPQVPTGGQAPGLYQNITDLQLSLVDSSDNVLATLLAGQSAVVSGLVAGEWYSLQIAGTVPGTLAGGGVWGGQYLGNLGVQEIPLPAAAWLFGTGLLALAGVARRRSLNP